MLQIHHIHNSFVIDVLFVLFLHHPGYEKVIGNLDVKTSSDVSFYVNRRTPYSGIGRIPFEVAQVNIGNAMNLASGVFTAPVNGRYYFSFISRSANSYANYIFLRLNSSKMGQAFTNTDNIAMPIIATLNLKKGDTVDVYLEKGSIQDNDGYYTQFNGILLTEDLAIWYKQVL